jgi:ribosomal protein S18 acetylase RimI-like enzyme
MEELASLAGLAEACDNDPYCMWAGQGLSAGGRIWVQGSAVAVACPALSGQDRIVLRGPHDAAIELVRDGSGSLTATAADAWSTPTVGFLAGVSVSESARGAGRGRDVCHFVLEDLLAVYGRASLMVHTWNTAAIRTYIGLGMSWRLLGSAWIGKPR